MTERELKLVELAESRGGNSHIARRNRGFRAKEFIGIIHQCGWMIVSEVEYQKLLERTNENVAIRESNEPTNPSGTTT